MEHMDEFKSKQSTTKLIHTYLQYQAPDLYHKSCNAENSLDKNAMAR